VWRFHLSWGMWNIRSKAPPNLRYTGKLSIGFRTCLQIMSQAWKPGLAEKRRAVPYLKVPLA
jgi:hypothetical protein